MAPKPFLAILTGCLLAATPVLADGIVACSTSDDAYTFHYDWQAEDFQVDGPIEILPEGNYPYDATMRFDFTEVWIVGASGDGVAVVDTWTGEVTHRIPVGDYPVSVAFSWDGDRALVSCRSDDGFYIIDTTTYQVIDTVPDPSDYLGPGNIALDPDTGNFYVVEWYDETLYEISPDGSTILRQAALGNSLWQLVVDKDTDRIYVTDRGTDVVRVIDRHTLTQVDTYPVGDDPWGIDLFDGRLVVTCEDSGEVYLIDTEFGTSTTIALPADADPRDVDIYYPLPVWLPDRDGGARDPQLEGAYVVGGRVGTESPVYVIDIYMEAIIESFDVPGTNTNVVAVAPQNWDLWPDAVEDLPSPRLAMALFPNPFNPLTHVEFTLAETGFAELAVYDVTGRLVRHLAAGSFGAGSHEFVWNGCDDTGEKVASGVYLVQVRTLGQRISQKAILTK